MFLTAALVVAASIYSVPVRHQRSIVVGACRNLTQRVNMTNLWGEEYDATL